MHLHLYLTKMRFYIYRKQLLQSDLSLPRLLGIISVAIENNKVSIQISLPYPFVMNQIMHSSNVWLKSIQHETSYKSTS